MSDGSRKPGGAGGALAALFFALGILILFVLLFSVFLILPFFIFLAGIVAMMISDRRRDKQKSDQEKADERAREDEAVDRENAWQRAQV